MPANPSHTLCRESKHKCLLCCYECLTPSEVAEKILPKLPEDVTLETDVPAYTYELVTAITKKLGSNDPYFDADLASWGSDTYSLIRRALRERLNLLMKTELVSKTVESVIPSYLTNLSNEIYILKKNFHEEHASLRRDLLIERAKAEVEVKNLLEGFEVSNVCIDRGFTIGLELTAEAYIKHAKKLKEVVPMCIYLSLVDVERADFLDVPELSNIQGISLEGARLTEEIVIATAYHPNTQNLVFLEASNQVSSEIYHHISQALPKLKYLQLCTEEVPYYINYDWNGEALNLGLTSLGQELQAKANHKLLWLNPYESFNQKHPCLTDVLDFKPPCR